MWSSGTDGHFGRFVTAKARVGFIVCLDSARMELAVQNYACRSLHVGAKFGQ